MTLAEQTARARWPEVYANSSPQCHWAHGMIYVDGQWLSWWPETDDTHAAELIEEARIGVMPWGDDEWFCVVPGARLIRTSNRARKVAICEAYLAWTEQRGKT